MNAGFFLNLYKSSAWPVCTTSINLENRLKMVEKIYKAWEGSTSPWFFLGICPFCFALSFVAWFGDGELSPHVLGRRLFWRACGHVWRTQRCHSVCCYCGGGPDITFESYGGILVQSWWLVRKLWVQPLPYFSLKSMNVICALSKVFFEGTIFGMVVMWMPSDFSLLVTLWPDFLWGICAPFLQQGRWYILEIWFLDRELACFNFWVGCVSCFSWLWNLWTPF